MAMGLADFFYLQYPPFEVAQVPCDLVVNAIIVVGMVTARQPSPKFQIYHCTSTGQAEANMMIDVGLDFLKYNPMETAVREHVGAHRVPTMS